MEKIGVTVTIEAVDGATYLEALPLRNYVAACRPIGGFIDDPDVTLGDFVTCNGSDTANYCNADVDRKFEQQASTIDPVERQKLVREIEIQALDDASLLVMFWKKEASAARNYVRNFVLHPEPDNNRRYDNIWLDL